ncbi:MAG: sodium-independent anion transporter, partial [Rhodobacterales bacterium]
MNANTLTKLRQDWLGNIRADLLAGLVVALALIPEAIAFSIIAGVDPKVGLYASFSIAVITALPELIGVTWLTYLMVAGGLAIIYLFPYITTAIPSPLVTIIILTALTMYFGLDVRAVKDMGQLPDTLPVFLLPDIPLTFETLKIIFPVSAGV